MKTARIPTQKLFATISAFTMLGAFGCVSDLSEPLQSEYGYTVTNATMEQALTSIADEMGLGNDGSLGRLDDRNEAPAFGSEVFRHEFRPDAESRDRGDLADDREVRDRLDRDDVRLFTILAVWGRIRPNDAEAIPLRWDPTISVAEGDLIRVRRTVHFDREDEVLPSDARNAVSIISRTMPHVDGVILQVAITPTDARTAYLGFNSGPLALRVPASSLSDLNQFTVVDRAGNGLMLTAIERHADPAACHHGFMSGRWARTRDNGGVFGGRLLTDDGEQVGHLAGRFGEGRFHGKIIGLDGRFRGLVAGVYGEGQYHGEIYNGDGQAVGSIRGHTTVGDEGGHGRFRGGWAQNCDRDQTDRPVCDGDDCERASDEGPMDRPDSDERPTDERPDGGTDEGGRTDDEGGRTDEDGSDEGGSDEEDETDERRSR